MYTLGSSCKKRPAERIENICGFKRRYCLIHLHENDNAVEVACRCNNTWVLSRDDGGGANNCAMAVCNRKGEHRVRNLKPSRVNQCAMKEGMFVNDVLQFFSLTF